MPSIGISISIIFELLLRDRLEYDYHQKNNILLLRDTTPTGDELLDEAIEIMKNKKVESTCVEALMNG
jgi:hypothetical protein